VQQSPGVTRRLAVQARLDGDHLVQRRPLVSAERLGFLISSVSWVSLRSRFSRVTFGDFGLWQIMDRSCTLMRTSLTRRFAATYW
jgi:hypothetical protein